MSQDGNNNIFGNPNFQPSPFDPSNLYHPDITSMQFAASVPQRPSNAQQHVPMNFPSFPNQDVMPPHPHFSMGFPGSPYERPDSLGSNSSTSKQLQSKAERRAEHNATERARRESLNVKFQQLAFTLPNLQNDSRPSKGTIIDRTLDFVKGAIIKEERMQYRINELEKFSRYLLSELDKKNNIKEPQQQQQEEQASVHSPLMNHNIANSISSPPAPGSVASEDSMIEEAKSDFSGHQPCLSATTATTKQHQQKKENGITNRRPVSRTSVPMIPKLDYTATTTVSNTPTTNWPITTSAPSMNSLKPQSNYHQLLEQQQQHLLLDQQLLMKDQPPMPMTNNVFQHSFNPTTTPTTNMRFQNTKFSEPEQDIFMNPLTADPSANFLFNNNSNNSFHHNLMELHHRR